MAMFIKIGDNSWPFVPFASAPVEDLFQMEDEIGMTLAQVSEVIEQQVKPPAAMDGESDEDYARRKSFAIMEGFTRDRLNAMASLIWIARRKAGEDNLTIKDVRKSFSLDEFEIIDPNETATPADILDESDPKES